MPLAFPSEGKSCVRRCYALGHGKRRSTVTDAGKDAALGVARNPRQKDNRAEINAPAATLQRQREPNTGTPRGPAHDNEALRERLTALGFDAKKTETLAKWQQLGTQVDAGRITKKDRFRKMAQYLWHEADKERRAGQQPRGKQSDQHAAQT
jgi:hypothetical protein